MDEGADLFIGRYWQERFTKMRSATNVDRDARGSCADVSWKEGFNHEELSAIQHAMNLKLQDEAVN